MIFDNTNLDMLGKTLKNKLTTDLNNFGMAVSYDDKLQVVLSLLEDLMEGK